MICDQMSCRLEQVEEAATRATTSSVEAMGPDRSRLSHRLRTMARPLFCDILIRLAPLKEAARPSLNGDAMRPLLPGHADGCSWRHRHRVEHALARFRRHPSGHIALKIRVALVRVGRRCGSGCVDGRKFGADVLERVLSSRRDPALDAGSFLR